jgi:hypothetical protein
MSVKGSLRAAINKMDLCRNTGKSPKTIEYHIYKIIMLKFTKKFIHYHNSLININCLSRDRMGLTILWIRTMSILTNAVLDYRES